MSNRETEAIAVALVMELERQAGCTPEDVHLGGLPYDVSSPPRKIVTAAPLRGLPPNMVGAVSQWLPSVQLSVSAAG